MQNVIIETMSRHVPVLLIETIEALNLSPGMNVIDCTLGDGGHAEKIMEAIAPDGKLLGIDADPESLLRAKQNLYEHQDRGIFVRDNFEHLSRIVASEAFSPVNSIVIDLGWSSPQFEDRGRGFSFHHNDERLDMRYDPRLSCEHTAVDPPTGHDGKPLYGRCTAAELVNVFSEDELTHVFRTYGEELQAERIARAIVTTRKELVLETVDDLVRIILSVYREVLKTDKEIPWVGGNHPATKVFQALRIAVNDELGVIERVLPQAIDTLEKGGRLAVITFHSLEDRLVKHYFKSKDGKEIEIITKKPMVATENELSTNIRARSAKLRVIEKK
jgi:16S rRNA (cytosine1402-N4)-methyltransferase